MNHHQLVTQNNHNTIELDEKFFIKNIDTGEIYHFQNDDSYQHIFEKINPNIRAPLLKPLNPEKIWQEYWKEVRKTREKLWNSCEIGDLPGLLAFLEVWKNSFTPIDINDRTLNNYTALHLACEHGHEKIVEILLTNQANVEARTNFGRTPLHLACSKGCVTVVRILLFSKACVDVCDEEQNTPLHMAAEINNYEIVDELLKQKPKTEIRNYQGMTAYDLCLDVKTRKLFEIHGVGQDFLGTYSRTDLGGTILNNARKDHVEKLLYLGKNNKKLVSSEMLATGLGVKKTMSAAFSSPLHAIEEKKCEDNAEEHKGIEKKKQITAFSQQNLKTFSEKTLQPFVNLNNNSNNSKNNDNTNNKNKDLFEIKNNLSENSNNSNGNTKNNHNNNNNGNNPNNIEYTMTKKNTLTNFLNFFQLSKKSPQEKDSPQPAIQEKPKMSIKDFHFYKILGKGSFGEVFLVKEKNPIVKPASFLAMKVLNKDKVFSQNLVKYVKSERNILSIMDHPFIVKLNYAFQSENKLYLLLDYCPGGDLGHVLSKKRRFPEEIVRIYISEIILGIEALHSKNIIFRDLKPDNVVLDKDGHALLTDFGLSRQGVDTNIAKSFCGSVAYLAPEMLAKAGHNKSIDWYLVGVLFYELLVGIPPFFSKNREEMFNNIKSGPLLIPKNLTAEAKDLMKRLLCRNPKNRLGAVSGALEVKSHAFFKDLNWDDVLQRKLQPPEIEAKNYETLEPDEELFLNNFAKEELKDGKPKDFNYIEGWSFEDKKLGNE